MYRLAAFYGACVFVLANGLFAADARAQAPQSSQTASSIASCGTENLIGGKRPVHWQDVRTSFAMVSDETVAPEGAQWDSPVATIFETGAGSVTFDLGQVYPVGAIYLQADANDSYKIMGSIDGSSYKELVEIDSVIERGHGLRGRSVEFAPVPVRFIRVGEGLGDGFFSVSELAAFCRAPTPFPPAMRVGTAPQAQVTSRPWYYFDWWGDKPSARLEMMLAIGALLLLGWGYTLETEGRAGYRKKLRDRLLMAVGLLSFCAYWNFGSFHFGNYIHYWDSYHYYVGSKYFKELGYDRLYDCASVADSEDPRLRRRVELRKIMNLRTNMMGPTTEILAHPERCKDHFTPERWEAFKKDIEFFRNNHGVKRWEEAQTDHGYNGTPVWNILGTTLANLAPASKTQLWALTLIDPLFILGMAAMIWWAFGWRVLCVAMAVFGTNFPSRFYWTGGAFLRWDWLFYMTAGVCLLKKEKPVIGGFFLAYSGLLRVFPVFLLLGPVFLLIQQLLDQTRGRKWWQRLPARELPAMIKRLDRKTLAVVLGAALAVGTLMPLSFVVSGGPSTYKAFVQNSKKHTATPLTNYMGWRTIVAYKEQEAGRYLRNDRLEDPWGEWKLARLRTFRERVWLYVAGIVAFAAFLYKAVRGSEPWVAAALASVMIAVIPELTCYYYSFLVVPALLWLKRRQAGIALLAVTAATGFIDMAPTQWLPRGFPWGHLRVMPEWLDEQYTWMSIATLAGLGWILYEFGYVKQTDAAVLASEPLASGSSEASKSPPSEPPPRSSRSAGRAKSSSRRKRS